MCVSTEMQFKMAKGFSVGMLLICLSINALGQDSILEPPSPIQMRFDCEKEPAPLNLTEVLSMVREPAGGYEIVGKFVVRILVDEKGNYKNHIVLSSPHPKVTEAYVAYLHHLKFTPAKCQGSPVPFWITVPIQRCFR